MSQGLRNSTSRLRLPAIFIARWNIGRSWNAWVSLKRGRMVQESFWRVGVRIVGTVVDVQKHVVMCSKQ